MARVTSDRLTIAARASTAPVLSVKAVVRARVAGLCTRNAAPLPIEATIAVATKGPMPGVCLVTHF